MKQEGLGTINEENATMSRRELHEIRFNDTLQGVADKGLPDGNRSTTVTIDARLNFRVQALLISIPSRRSSSSVELYGGGVVFDFDEQGRIAEAEFLTMPHIGDSDFEEEISKVSDTEFAKTMWVTAFVGWHRVREAMRGARLTFHTTQVGAEINKLDELRGRLPSSDQKDQPWLGVGAS